MLWGKNRGKWKKPTVTGSRTQDTWLEPPVFCHWATTARQPPVLTILYMYCTGGTECLGYTPGSHSVCTIRTPLGVNQKILSIRKEPMLSGLLTLNAQSILPHAEFRCYETKVEKSWHSLGVKPKTPLAWAASALPLSSVCINTNNTPYFTHLSNGSLMPNRPQDQVSA